ncbi:flagellar hook-associated protein FlgK [Mobilitalea sibirica]|uniref:Flagellar hook-associated protein 1 n=1 Tax=Mobilitalea sibirica TaxID=1462919 RepID=A0A8J7KY00_9FIRM|nr:flagellar hook-associated protein FlgK [Mobilitalea sibirica]MBH1942462.1 flagellar hook-associated protein FlgK [Mobilitalea sibirica]
MASTFFGLNIGKTGLYAYQAALDTTAHNITNTETEGYTRQVMGQQAGKALSVNSTYGMAGTGVSVTGVKQLRDYYYDMKYWSNNTMYGEYSYKSHYMTEVENYFNEVSVEGFTTTFNSMFDSIQELSKNPASLTVRTQVINYAKSLTEYFSSISQSLKSIQDECNFEIRNKVDQVNSTAQQIAALTKQINTLEVNGGAANDLRDQRALLVDELSEIANISVTEKTVGAGIGVTSYVIKLDNQTLVDGGNYNSLHVIPRKEKHNQNDVDGLYDVAWANGQRFNMGSASLGGALQALYEVRDGNNSANLKGVVSAEAGDFHISVTDTTINEVEKLNIPENGRITVGNREYVYNGFEVTKDVASGNFIYTFTLDEPIVVDVANEVAHVGQSIDYKGIPYYMEQMNEFIRTFAKAFNEIHRSGKDLENNSGADFFNATNKINGREYVFGPLADSDDYPYFDFDTFNSQTGDYYEEIPENQPLYGSYYFMTAENFTVSTELIQDSSRMATATDIVNGNENNDIVDALMALKTNSSLFKQGAPGGFMQTLTAEIGIDTKKATNFSESQNNILQAIVNQRLSVSGVDMDEEAMNLVRFQNAYNLSAKVISVMDEVYDKLINYMGV